jgi:hypothetical protein
VSELTYDEWVVEGTRRFGADRMQWRFVCPSCGYVASGQDWKDAGAPEGAIGYSCVGRYTGSEKKLFDRSGGPCDYAGGGLIGLNPVRVAVGGKAYDVFAFAGEEGEEGAE